MVTTAVVAEIVVAGLQAVAWIGLLVGAIFGLGWIDPAELESFSALVTILVLAMAYVLGVVVDRAADTLLLSLYGVWPPRPVDKPASIDTMRLRLMAGDDGVARFLDYQRSRMRLARATTLNLGLLLPALVAFLAAESEAGTTVIAAAAALVALAAWMVYLAFRRIDFTYVQRLSQAYRIATDPGGEPEEPAIAAAICYRKEDGRLEFRLVRTKDERRWTFPKGHRERRETLPQAAYREAREEAGVRHGSVDGTRLATFRYPATRPWGADEDIVAAFLVKVKSDGEPEVEKFRKPRWSTVEESRGLLAECREPSYAAELDRTLLAAVAQIDSG